MMNVLQKTTKKGELTMVRLRQPIGSVVLKTYLRIRGEPT